jgi:hypothetical protein
MVRSCCAVYCTPWHYEIFVTNRNDYDEEQNDCIED